MGITHERMARIMFPGLNRQLIERVDREIDTADSAMPSIAAARVPGMSYKGHRKYGHDLFTAGLIGYSEGGPEGLKAAWTHLFLDRMRDQMTKSVGYEGADLMEAAWNYIYGQNNRRRR